MKHQLRWQARPGTRAAKILRQLNRLRQRRTMRLRWAQAETGARS